MSRTPGISGSNDPKCTSPADILPDEACPFASFEAPAARLPVLSVSRARSYIRITSFREVLRIMQLQAAALPDDTGFGHGCLGGKRYCKFDVSTIGKQGKGNYRGSTTGAIIRMGLHKVAVKSRFSKLKAHIQPLASFCQISNDSKSSWVGERP